MVLFVKVKVFYICRIVNQLVIGLHNFYFLQDYGLLARNLKPEVSGCEWIIQLEK